MALVQCPECRRNNVSDSADVCPDCGYGIKQHFDKIKEDQEKQRKQDEEKIKKEVQHQEKLNKVEMPHMPFPVGIIISIIFIVILSIPIAKEKSMPIPDTETITWCVVFIVVFSIIMLISISLFKNRVMMYKLAKRDFKGYQEKYLSDKDATEAVLKQMKENKESKNATPNCPVCGSRSTTRITTAGRMVSVGTVGLASSKIGKQYRCMNCKHQW